MKAFNNRKRILIYSFFALSILGLLSGCDGWIGKAEEPPLPGKRIPILLNTSPDQSLLVNESFTVDLPIGLNIMDWPNAGGNDNHSMGHLYAGSGFKLKNSTHLAGYNNSNKLISSPVIGEDKIFVLGTDNSVVAYSRNFKLLWKQQIMVEGDEDSGLGGGLSYEDGSIYVTTGSSQVHALQASTGKILWTKNLIHPFRSSPIVSQGRVFVVNIMSQVFALDISTGETLWSQQAFSEEISLLGGATPAVYENILIVAHSSGEVFAHRVENGQVAWLENVHKKQLNGALNTFSDIISAPVIDKDIAIVANHSNQIVAIDVRTGIQRWSAPYGTTKMPWVAGNVIYISTSDSKLVCLARDTGEQVWSSNLPSYLSPDDREDPIFWNGPILAGNRIMVTSNRGEVRFYEPVKGNKLSISSFHHGTSLPTLLVNGVYYFLDTAGNLLAYNSK